MSAGIRKYRTVVRTVDAAEYTGSAASMKEVLEWIVERGGDGFAAKELGWRHDFGTYHHPERGFIYLPSGARTPGGALEMLKDNELVVRTGSGFALVFPGDFVVRSRYGFYPLRAESFNRYYQPSIAAGEQASVGA